jgi:hypothetical protein
MRRALSGENIMAKNNDKVPGKTKEQTCRPEKPKLRVISSELDVHAQVERLLQKAKEEKKTYNLSAGKILKRAFRSASGEFEIKMREFFEEKAENALIQIELADMVPSKVLRQYLLAGAKIAIIEFLLRPQTQEIVRSHYRKRIKLLVDGTLR